MAAAAAVAVGAASIVQYAASSATRPAHRAPSITGPSKTTLPGPPPDHSLGGPIFGGAAPTHGTMILAGEYGLRRVDLATGRISVWSPSGLPGDGMTLHATDGQVTVVSTEHAHSLFAITNDRAAAVAGDGAWSFVGPDNTVWIGQPGVAQELDGTHRRVTFGDLLPYAAVNGGFVADTGQDVNRGLVLVDPTGQHEVRTLAPAGAVLVAAHPDRIAWSDSDCAVPTCFVHVVDVATARDEVVAHVGQTQGFDSGAFSADGRYLAVRSGPDVHLIDLAKGNDTAVVAGTTVAGVHTLAFTGATVVSIAGSNGVVAATGPSATRGHAAFADVGEVALWPIERSRPAPPLTTFVFPPLFGRRTGLRALSGERVLDVDTGVAAGAVVDQLDSGNGPSAVPFANGVLIGARPVGQGIPTVTAELVDATGKVTALGPTTRILGTDGLHAWLERRAADGEWDYYPIDATSSRLGAPIRSFVPAVNAAGSALAFVEQRVATPHAFLLVDDTGHQRLVPEPPGTALLTMNATIAVSYQVDPCGPCRLVVTSLISGATHTVPDLQANLVTASNGLVLAPTGTLALVGGAGANTLVDLGTGAVVGDPFLTTTAGGAAGGWSSDGWLLASDGGGATLVAPDGTRTHGDLTVLNGPFVLVHAP